MKKQMRQMRTRQLRRKIYRRSVEFKDRLVLMFLTDPGRFSGSPREFAWRELRKAAEARRGRAG